MHTKDAIRATLDTSMMVQSAYLADLNDEELLIRPVPGANHIAWQLGHLIQSENSMLEALKPGAAVELPPDFAEQHGKETASQEPPTGFATKAEYIDLQNRVRERLNQLLNEISDADLVKPNPGPTASFAPTLGSLLVLAGTHMLMHVGQYAVVRRKLGKPIAI